MMDSEALPAFIKPVKVHLETSAPSMGGTKVGVSYCEAGSSRRISVATMRPIYFEKLVVSSVYETLPSFYDSYVPLNGIRSLARNGLYACNRIGLSVRKPVILSTPVLDMRELYPNNMAHLLLNMIPYYLLAKRALGPDIKVLLLNVKEPFASLLSTFGIHPLHENRRVTADIIKIRGTRGLAVFDLFGSRDCEGIDFVPDAYSEMDFSSHLKFDRIFLARRAPRNLDNQAEMEKLAGKYGYKTIFLEDYSIREQLSIGAQAKHVIAVHGAAMSFLLMNRKIDSLIELFPPHVYDDIFSKCLSPRVGRYEQIIADFDARVAHSGWSAILYFKNRNFSANTNLVEQLLSEIH
jgi:hypothetical protein